MRHPSSKAPIPCQIATFRLDTFPKEVDVHNEICRSFASKLDRRTFSYTTPYPRTRDAGIVSLKDLPIVTYGRTPRRIRFVAVRYRSSIGLHPHSWFVSLFLHVHRYRSVHSCVCVLCRSLSMANTSLPAAARVWRNHTAMPRLWLRSTGMQMAAE